MDLRRYSARKADKLVAIKLNNLPLVVYFPEPSDVVRMQVLVISDSFVRDLLQKMNSNTDFDYPFKCGFFYKYFPNIVADLKQATLEQRQYEEQLCIYLSHKMKSGNILRLDPFQLESKTKVRMYIRYV